MNNYSYELIELLMEAKGWNRQAPVLEFINKLTQGNLSDIKKGLRHLTPAQALQIANELGLNTNEVLIQLSLEKAKSNEESKAWSGMLEVIKKSGTTGLALILTISHESISDSVQCILC